MLHPQSLDDAELRLLGREHTAAEARAAAEAARKLFPGRVSLDLIFGLPGQSREAWARGLEAALGLCDDHLALYQLTLERGTALEAQVRRGVLPEPPEDLLADLYLSARATLAAAGFHQYEVSNFARKVSAPASSPRHRRSPSSPTAPLSCRAPAAPTTSPTGGPSSTWVWGQVSPGVGGGDRAPGRVCAASSLLPVPSQGRTAASCRGERAAACARHACRRRTLTRGCGRCGAAGTAPGGGRR